jgi:hypothetical protein
MSTLFLYLRRNSAGFILANVWLLCVARQTVQAQPTYAPGSEPLLFVSCVGWPGGNPVYPCFLTIRSFAFEVTSNGHTRSGSYHPTPIPSSAFTTSSNGPWFHWAAFTLAGPQTNVWIKVGERGDSPNPATDIRKRIGHDEYLNACADVCSGYSFRVGWTDIYWVEEKPEWIHTGLRPEHGNSNSFNHWMTSTAAYGIWYAAKDFLNAHPAQGKIAVNDMALPFGGLFDITAQWQPSHWEHYRGKAVDVAAGSGTYAIPNSQADEFVTYCVNRGAYYGQVEQPPTAPLHIHCQWP